MSPDPASFRSAEIARLVDRADRADSAWRLSSVIVAAGLHVALGAWMLYRVPAEVVAPPGDLEISIDLAPAAMEVASVGAGDAAQDAPEVTEVDTVEETPEEIEPEVVEAEPVEPEVIEAEPLEPDVTETAVAQAEELPPVEAPVVEKAEVAVAPPRPRKPPPPKRPVERRIEKPVTQKPPPPRRPPSASAQAGARGQAASEVSGSGARGNANDLSRYIGRVRAALERRKRYPAAARPNQGTATVRFTISRSGGVTGASIVRSAGHPALDEAALAMARGGSFPAIPASLPQSTITVTAPVRFNTR